MEAQIHGSVRPSNLSEIHFVPQNMPVVWQWMQPARLSCHKVAGDEGIALYVNGKKYIQIKSNVSLQRSSNKSLVSPKLCHTAVKLNRHSFSHRPDLVAVNLTHYNVRWLKGNGPRRRATSIHATGICYYFAPRVHNQRVSVAPAFCVVLSKLSRSDDITLTFDGSCYRNNIAIQ